jgi:hypothetical protein
MMSLTGGIFSALSSILTNVLPILLAFISCPVRVYVKLLSHSGKSEIPRQINTNYRLDK